MADQIPFAPDIRLAENPEDRCPCVLLLDVSDSMSGEPIAEINAGVQAFRNDLVTDTLAAQRVEVAVVTFGGTIETRIPFTCVDEFQPPTLTTSGDTPMGAAIVRAISMVNDRKQRYREARVHYYRPWIFMVTDGQPTDSWEAAAEEVKRGEADKRFAFFAIGTPDANFDTLRRISTRVPLRTSVIKFREMFLWLSGSQRAVSRSRVGDEDKVPFADPTGPKGWATL